MVQVYNRDAIHKHHTSILNTSMLKKHRQDHAICNDMARSFLKGKLNALKILKFNSALLVLRLKSGLALYP